MIVKEEFNSLEVNMFKGNIIKGSIGYYFCTDVKSFFFTLLEPYNCIYQIEAVGSF